jgi:hypothetical protein
MNPTLEQLARYVVQELERGVPEIALQSSLRESGWTSDWINAALSLAKQRPAPERPQLTMPHVQPVANQANHLPQRVAARPHQRSLVHPVATPATEQKAQAGPLLSSVLVKRVLQIVVALLAIVVLGLSLYRTVNHMHQQAAARVVYDAERREDLSVLLSNLSDYYITHKSYPTRTQLNTASFLHENGFSEDSITDPRWSTGIEACSKDGKPILSGVVAPNCYTYEVQTSEGKVCNNGTTPCTRAKVTIYLETDKQPTYAVAFDKNTQTDW